MVQVIESIKKKLGVDVESVVIPKPANFIEIPDQFMDSSKLAALGFKPRVTFDEGLDRAIAWYQTNRKYLAKLGYKYLT